MTECFTQMLHRNTGAQLQRLAKSSYKVEARATGMLYKNKIIYVCFGGVMISTVTLKFTLYYHAVDLIDRLREIPSREALALRAEASLYDFVFVFL